MKLDQKLQVSTKYIYINGEVLICFVSSACMRVEASAIYIDN